MTPKINTRHPDYEKQLPTWERIKACLGGERAVKAELTKLLPMPSMDTEAERYNSYLARAVFHPVTARTVDNMSGQCFAVDPVLELPPEIESITHNIDGAGKHAFQQAKQALSGVLSYSRGGLFVDYPKTEGVVSIAQAEAGGIRPRIIFYNTFEIINWRFEVKGAQEIVTKLVLEEMAPAKDDGFEIEFEKQWRVLALEGGIYTIRVWKKAGGGFTMVEEIIPTTGDGSPLKEIPFVFIGAEANSAEVEKPLMEDLANLNLAHYRNSADYEDSVFMVGQPTPYFTGLTKKWVDDVMQGKVVLGSRSSVPLPEGATAGLLQASENSMVFAAMQHKEKQMRAIGAKLIERRETQATATEKTIEESNENSILAGICNNVSAAYRKALVFCAGFANVEISEGSLSFELNTEFAVSSMNPEAQKAIVELFRSELISFSEAREKLRASGLAFLTDDEVKGELEEQSENYLLKAKQATV